MNKRKKEPNKVFNATGKFLQNACLNTFQDNWETYCGGYKKAADVLVEYVIEKREHLDELIYPIVFLYRQYIELQLKSIINETNRMPRQKKSIPIHHDIVQLWDETSSMCKKLLPNIKIKPGAKKIIKEFMKIDPKSDAFRYPTGKNGGQSITGLEHINVGLLSARISELEAILDELFFLIRETRKCNLY